MISWLVDTGPLFAYLYSKDPHHSAVAARIDAFTGRLVTTSPVMTGAMHFLAAVPEGPTRLAQLTIRSHIQVFDFTQPQQLVQASALMHKYAGTSMDFADATLVLLAEELEVLDILTIDRRGFSTFRTPNGKRFNLVLDA